MQEVFTRLLIPSFVFVHWLLSEGLGVVTSPAHGCNRTDAYRIRLAINALFSWKMNGGHDLIIFILKYERHNIS